MIRDLTATKIHKKRYQHFAKIHKKCINILQKHTQNISTFCENTQKTCQYFAIQVLYIAAKVITGHENMKTTACRVFPAAMGASNSMLNMNDKREGSRECKS